MGYSQPTISFQIKQLENELGVQLFDRIGHTINLTEEGREVLVYAQQICNMMQEMTQSAAISSLRRAMCTWVWQTRYACP